MERGLERNVFTMDLMIVARISNTTTVVRGHARECDQSRVKRDGVENREEKGTELEIEKKVRLQCRCQQYYDKDQKALTITEGRRRFKSKSETLELKKGNAS